MQTLTLNNGRTIITGQLFTGSVKSSIETYCIGVIRECEDLGIDVSDLRTEWENDYDEINTFPIMYAAVDRINEIMPDGFYFGVSIDGQNYGYWENIPDETIVSEVLSDTVIRLHLSYALTEQDKPQADKIQSCFSYSYGGIMYLVYGANNEDNAKDILCEYIGDIAL